MAVEREQDESEATAAPELNREDSRIDWTDPASDIANQIRGMYPWPGCRVRVLRDDREFDRLTFVTAEAVRQYPPMKYLIEKIKAGYDREGVIQDDFSIGANLPWVIRLIEVQPEGKKPMTLAAYRNGHLWEPGMRVESL